MENYKIGLYEKAMPEHLTWKEKLEIAKISDYDYVEMSIDQTDNKINRINMTQQECLELVSLMNEMNMPIRSICLSALTKYSLGNEDEKLSNKGMYILKETIKLADDLGIHMIMIPGYDVYYEKSTHKTQKKFLENIEKAVEIASIYGVVLGLETMENAFMNTVWKAMYYIQQINSPYLAIYPDSGNIKNAAVESAGDELKDLASGRGHMIALHLKESKERIFREVPYGEGHVDFEGIISTAWSMGIRRYVTEFWYTGNTEWKEEILRNNKRMRKLLDMQIKSKE